MRIVLCGVPGMGKAEFENELNLKYDLPATTDVASLLEGIYQDHSPASGFLADYRLELFLASFRALEHIMEKDMVFVNSLLDSIAYATTITSLKIQTNDSELDTWMAMFQFFPTLIEDSFLYDLVIRFPYTGEEEMMQILDANLELALTNFEIPYILHTERDTIFAKIEEEHKIMENWTSKGTDAIGI